MTIQKTKASRSFIVAAKFQGQHFQCCVFDSLETAKTHEQSFKRYLKGGIQGLSKTLR